MKRNKCGRFVSSAVAQKMERLSEAQRQRWLRARRPRPTGEAEAEPPVTGRAPTAASLIMTTSYCRLCHGKFSSRSLRNVFAKVPLIETSPERQRRAQQTFCGDFQKLVGVVVRQDSTLPQYICRNCHAQFYKCWTILKNFIQKVNTSPVAAVQHGQKASRCVAATETSSVQSLSQSPLSNSVSEPVNCNEASCSVRNDVVDGLESSDLSERYLSSEDDREIKVKNGSSDESFQPYWKKKSKLPVKKCNIKDVKKQSGQKRGRKPKSNLEREDFPTMYRCQYKGCCAVYRGVDGLKKHIKEQHEEVRERPCPHPGCNKVFLIDRYLQRHVKLIHTEERNYICDECGQTFKQRKHLSVHQMRHTGAKPLQCEVCGFQCRQRASLKYHMTKHKAEAELEFACDQCEKRFEKAHNLNVHMSMVHPLTQNTDKNKPIEIESSRLSIETLIKQEPS
ncbi:zinc finger protein 276 isoform X2 [Amblyraja radiata]|uniref:zinc finger protein 276 isoform X2 n=1 Tax=Amblyraja radiata TaxID=386614 RepID=UPI00140235EB|nr:zinc finger protein 276 isoform X2 [Amblyraja radiata]